MKYIIFGDVHGRSLKHLEKILQKTSFDIILCTGDFDSTEVVAEFQLLEQKYKSKGKQIFTVTGNHDHHILEDEFFSSPILMKKKINSWDLHKEFVDNPIMYNYLQQIVYENGLLNDVIDINDTFNKIILVHGGLDGSLISNLDCEESLKKLWFRMRNEQDLFKNFNVMQNKGYNIMIRGHDHDPFYAFMCEEKGSICSVSPSQGNHLFELEKNRMHIINHGAYYKGNIVLLDLNQSSSSTLQYLRF